MEPLFLRLGSEVRQGLHHILGLIEIASEEPLSTSQAHSLDHCREAADQLRRTAEDLTELARGEGFAGVSAAFNPAGAIGEIAGLMGTLAGRKGLSFHWTAEGLPARVQGDKPLLQDILRRLLDNAIRFTASGTVRLSAAGSAGPAASMVLTFEISDTGAGIPPEIIEDLDADVIQPRTQGLSLRILHKRVAALNGTISIAPNSPQGTTVRVSLPVALVEADPDRAFGAANGSSNPPLRLLVAEDNDNSFRLFMSYVKAAGHSVSRVLDGAAAVEMAKHGNYDLIVMDVNMPHLDGYAATRQIREWETEEELERLPILLLSADDSERQVRLGGAAGCSGHLTKPTTKAQVLAALNYYAQSPLKDFEAGGGRFVA